MPVKKAPTSLASKKLLVESVRRKLRAEANALAKKRANKLIQHSERARKWSLFLARKEGVDSRVVELASLAHDIGKAEAKKNHHERGAKIVGKTLSKVKISAKEKKEVKLAVSSHRARSASAKAPINSKIVQCADTLAKIRAPGFEEKIQTMPPVQARVALAKARKKLVLESARIVAQPVLEKLENRAKSK